MFGEGLLATTTMVNHTFDELEALLDAKGGDDAVIEPLDAWIGIYLVLDFSLA